MRSSTDSAFSILSKVSFFMLHLQILQLPVWVVVTIIV
jgi:hypothetical protein